MAGRAGKGSQVPNEVPISPSLRLTRACMHAITSVESTSLPCLTALITICSPTFFSLPCPSLATL